MSSRKAKGAPAARREPGSGFEYGARVLGTSVDAIVRIYERTIHVLEVGMSAGKTNPFLGYMAYITYVDLLHGGSYAAPINERPFNAPDPAQSQYYAGELKNLPGAGLGGFFATALAGVDASDLANEVLQNANVPHVFPKLVSDEAYAMIKILYAQGATTDLFKATSTGVATLVEGITGGEGVQSFLGGEEGKPMSQAQGASILQRVNALAAIVAKLA